MSCFHSEVWFLLETRGRPNLGFTLTLVSDVAARLRLLVLIQPWLFLTCLSVSWQVMSFQEGCVPGLACGCPLPASHLKQKQLWSHLLEVGGNITMPDLL